MTNEEWDKIIDGIGRYDVMSARPKNGRGSESIFVIDSLGSFEYTTESKPVYASVRDKRKNINIEGEYT